MCHLPPQRDCAQMNETPSVPEGRHHGAADLVGRARERSHLVDLFLVTSLLLMAVFALVRASEILIPLAIAVLFWFFINALAGFYQRLWSRWFGPHRMVSLPLAFLTFLVISLMVVRLVAVNVTEIGARANDFEHSLDLLVGHVAELTGTSNDEVINTIVNNLSIERLVTAIVLTMTGIASQFGIVFIYIIFLVIEQRFFDLKLRAVVPDENRRKRIRSMIERIGQDIQSYLWTMTVASVLTAILSYAVMRAVGLDSAAFWAFLIFTLNYIPTIGSILATAIPALYALLQFGDFAPFIVLLAAIGVIQFIIGNIVQPRLAAKSLNLSQFVVILALFVWGAIWGVVGMFLAVPLTAIVMLVCSNFERTRPLAIILSESGALKEEPKQ
jgi:AI-2 transport protein TqsA